MGRTFAWVKLFQRVATRHSPDGRCDSRDFVGVYPVVTGDVATHLRLSGPRAVVAKHYPAFEKWLKSIK